MNKLKIGIVGIGNMGSAHARCVAKGEVEGCELACVCDLDEKKLEWASENLPGIARYSDWKEMINSGTLDAVLIATPHYLHPDIAVAAFEAGLHVLTEKPAGVYTQAVEVMNAAAERSGKVFGIMFQQRTNPQFSKIRELVKSGVLGEPKRLIWIITNWYRTQYYYDSGTWRATWEGEGGGVLMNQSPHQLDLWQWIFGMPEKVRANCKYGQWHNVEIEDDVTAYAEYANGATATFITTTGEYPGTNRLEISGDRGKLVWENGKVTLYKLEMSERELCFTAQDSFAQPPFEVSEVECPGVDTGHCGIMQNFTNAILYGEELIAPGYDGINGLTLCNAMYLSDWTGEIVTLPIDAAKFKALLDERRATSRLKTGESKTPDGEYSSRWSVR